MFKLLCLLLFKKKKIKKKKIYNFELCSNIHLFLQETHFLVLDAVFEKGNVKRWKCATSNCCLSAP